MGQEGHGHLNLGSQEFEILGESQQPGSWEPDGKTFEVSGGG